MKTYLTRELLYRAIALAVCLGWLMWLLDRPATFSEWMRLIGILLAATVGSHAGAIGVMLLADRLKLDLPSPMRLAASMAAALTGATLAIAPLVA